MEGQIDYRTGLICRNIERDFIVDAAKNYIFSLLSSVYQVLTVILLCYFNVLLSSVNFQSILS